MAIHMKPVTFIIQLKCLTSVCLPPSCSVWRLVVRLGVGTMASYSYS